MIVETVERASGITAAIASVVEEQGAATQEVGRSVQQAAQGTRQVSGSIESVVGSAGLTNRSAAGVLQAAHDIAGETKRLGAQVDSFIVAVRAL